MTAPRVTLQVCGRAGPAPLLYNVRRGIVGDDLKTALRSLRSSTSVTVVALIVLILGIGATTAIFSVVDAVVLRSLPFDQQHQLVALGERSVAGPLRPDDPDKLGNVSPQNYVDWAAQQQVFESIAAIASGWLTLRVPGAEPESIVPQRVTASFFDVLRVRPSLGRAFTSANEVAGRERVVVLSYAVWRRHFGGDPNVIGRFIPLEDLEGGPSAADSGGYEVVGVMPPDFAYPVGVTRPTDIWIPYVVPPEQRVRDPHSRYIYLQVIARLKPAVSLTQAKAHMDLIATAIEKANPEWNRGLGIGVRPLLDHVVGTRIRSWMLMLLGAVGLVLLIACANIANLFLARASARERDVAVRAALGASRWRLVRQFMIESLVLSAAGTVCAVGVAWWVVRLLRASMPDDLPRVTSIALDGRVLVATAGIALVTTVLFGIIPALAQSKPDLSNALKDGARGTAGRGRQRLRSVLVVSEVALALVLLVGAALFIGSFVSLIRIDPGFDADHVLTAQISPRIESRETPKDAAPAMADIVERISHIPGVVHASASVNSLPLSGYTSMKTISIPGKDFRLLNPNGVGVSVRHVSADYHRALKIPLRAGRLFNTGDRKGSPAVVIINESAAREFFPHEEPLGRTITIEDDRTVVGVVGDVHHMSLERDPLAEAYIPLEQSRAVGGDLAIRTLGNPYDVLPAVKSAVYEVLPDVPLRNVRTLEELLGTRVAQRKVSMMLLALFGLLGLVISAVGIYGVISCLVAQQTREIGVRMALGATRSRVVSTVLRNASGLVGAGLLVGGVASWYLSAGAKAFLFGLQATDLRALAAAILALSIAATIAVLVPARRAASVDPIVALRAE
jgi:putative ABC transport system permease protein